MNDTNQTKKTLVIGIGNYGRSDDALGWKFIDEFAVQSNLFDIEYRYQLQIEDAELVSQYEKVIFVDASHTPVEGGFSFYRCHPVPTSNFTTHQLKPETVIWLAGQLFSAPFEAYVMAISGVTWDLKFGLSAKATDNFNDAINHFQKWLNLKCLDL